MNLYRQIGDQIGTADARELADQILAWHDAMVRHLRVAGRRRTDRCDDGCPHDEAAALWTAASHVFGGRAQELAFLRRYGEGAAAGARKGAARSGAELRA
jgi:hypothetical protein